MQNGKKQRQRGRRKTFTFQTDDLSEQLSLCALFTSLSMGEKKGQRGTERGGGDRGWIELKKGETFLKLFFGRSTD